MLNNNLVDFYEAKYHSQNFFNIKINVFDVDITLLNLTSEALNMT